MERKGDDAPLPITAPLVCTSDNPPNPVPMMVPKFGRTLAVLPDWLVTSMPRVFAFSPPTNSKSGTTPVSLLKSWRRSKGLLMLLGAVIVTCGT